jgi:SAM-dependent methyltransferase
MGGIGQFDRGFAGLAAMTMWYDVSVSGAFSVLIPFESRSSQAAAATAGAALDAGAAEVVVSGEGDIQAGPRVRRVLTRGGRGEAVQRGVREVESDCTVLLEPNATAVAAQLPSLCAPVLRDRADVVVGTSRDEHPILNRLARELSDLPVRRPLGPVQAIRTDALKSLKLVSRGAGVSAEILVKLAAQSFRFQEVTLPEAAGRRSISEAKDLVATFVRYALFANDADNEHEGYNTLERLESAPHYNAWLGSKLRPHLGRRVLEVGAGIGTLTKEIAEGRERVIALEADPYYAQRLSNLFRGSSVVQPLHAPVEQTDWAALARENLDTVFLSNVLEHIEDDQGAVRHFRSVLPSGGRLVVLVPALPPLFGTLDEAVGHHRRYDPETLRQVIESNGFEIDSMEWLNLLGILGWYLNGKILKRRVLPALQLRIYDRIAPLLARAEAMWKLPVGLSLITVARAR